MSNVFFTRMAHITGWFALALLVQAQEIPSQHLYLGYVVRADGNVWFRQGTNQPHLVTRGDPIFESTELRCDPGAAIHIQLPWDGGTTNYLETNWFRISPTDYKRVDGIQYGPTAGATARNEVIPTLESLRSPQDATFLPIITQQYGITRKIPPLQEILTASVFLTNNDIPQDNFLPPTNTLYVGSNAPYTNLEDAIAFANANPATSYTIYIEGGVYYYKSTGNAYLYGQNIERGNLYITAVPDETVELRPVTWTNVGGNPNTIWTASAFQINGGISNVTIDNLTFAGWQTLFNFNYSSAPSSNLTFKNIECTDFRYRDGDTNEYRSIIETAYNDPGVFSTPDEFTNAESYQYQIYGLILSNIYVENTDIGVNIGDEENPNVRGVRISNVNIYDPITNYNNTALDGIAVVNCYKVLIDDCTVVNVVGDGIDTKSRDISVVNCFVDNPARQGIKFWWNGEMINTIVYNANSPDDAIYLWRQGPIRMINCDTIHKPQVGYAAENGTANVQDTAPTTEQPIYLVNDIWAYLPRGAFFETTNVISLDSWYFDFTNGYPLITSINNDDTQLGIPNIYTTAQLNALPDCGGNTTNNPDFLNLATFELAPQSPCIAAGTNYGGTINGKSILTPTFDFYGAQRRIGLPPDVGAVAFSATLNFFVSSNQITLSWLGPFYLQQNTNLANATGWLNVPGGTNSPFSIPIGTGNLYLRLHSN